MYSDKFRATALWATINSPDFCAFKAISEADLARQVRDVFHEETQRLTGASVMESGTPPPELSCNGDAPRTPSQILDLRESDHEEVNRTYLSVWGLKWILNGDYDRFVKGQPEVVKLKKPSFEWLKQYYEDNLRTPEQLLTLITAIMVNDVGKDPELRSDLEKKTKQKCEGNHDIVLFKAAKAGLIPSLNNIDQDSLKLILKGIEMGSDFNAAQLAQAENVPVNLEGLLIMKGDEAAFNLKFMEIILDVAGASGHIFSDGIKNFIEPVCQAFKTTKEVCLSIVKGESTLRQGYDIVLSKRAELLHGSGFRNLSVDVPEERALLRLLTMGRTAAKPQAELFDDAFRALQEPAKSNLVTGLNVDAINDNEIAVLPYYMPAMFAETIRNTRGSGKEQEALTCLMGFLSRVLQPPEHEQIPAQPHYFLRSAQRLLPQYLKHWLSMNRGRVFERDVSCAHEIISSPEFKTNPGLLDLLQVPSGYFLPRPHAS